MSTSSSSIDALVDQLNDPTTDVVQWVKQALSSSTLTPTTMSTPPPSTTVATNETNTNQLQKRLQAVLFDANCTLDASMQNILQSIPSLNDELERILQEGHLLNECLNEINSRVETTYDDEEPLDDSIDLSSAVDPLQKLLDLETVLVNMKTTSDKLSHHALWNKTIRSARQRMYSEDILPAASLLSQLHQTLIVLQELPGHEERKRSLESLSTEFDNSLRPGLKNALKMNDTVKLKMYLNIFLNMNDIDGFETLYIDTRVSLLSSGWLSSASAAPMAVGGPGDHHGSNGNNGSNGSSNDRKQQIVQLNNCLLDVRALIKQEQDDQLPALFQTAKGGENFDRMTVNHDRMLKKMIKQGYCAIQLKGAENNVPLKDVLEWYSIIKSNLDELYVAVVSNGSGNSTGTSGSDKSGPNDAGDHLKALKHDVLNQMFHKYYQHYSLLEHNTMMEEMAVHYPYLYTNNDNTTNHDDETKKHYSNQLEQLYDALYDHSDGCFTVLKNSMQRCSLFLSSSHNAQVLTTQLAKAMSTAMLEFHTRAQTRLQLCSSSSSSSFSSSGSMEKQTNKQKNDLIALRMILIFRKHHEQMNQCIKEYQQWYNAQQRKDHYTETTTTTTTDECLHQIKDVTLQSIQVSVRTAYSICMSPILNVLKPLTSMTHIWSKITEEDEEEEDFEIYGQLEYATVIGEYLIDLVQKLEPLEGMLVADDHSEQQQQQQQHNVGANGTTATDNNHTQSQNCLLQGVDMLTIVEKEWDRSAVELNLNRADYIDSAWSTSSWLTLISHGTVATYVTMITTSMLHLSEYGATQLSEDIHYLLNVTSAMGVVTSPMLQHMHALLSMKREELQKLSDQSEKESRPTATAVVTMDDAASAIPRGLLLKICKMRGILVSF